MKMQNSPGVNAEDIWTADNNTSQFTQMISNNKAHALLHTLCTVIICDTFTQFHGCCPLTVITAICVDELKPNINAVSPTSTARFPRGTEKPLLCLGWYVQQSKLFNRVPYPMRGWRPEAFIQCLSCPDSRLTTTVATLDNSGKVKVAGVHQTQHFGRRKLSPLSRRGQPRGGSASHLHWQRLGTASRVKMA